MTKSINIVRCWLIADNHWLISATSQFAGKRLGSDSGGTVVPALCNARAVLDRGKHEVECVAGALEGIRVLDCSQIIAGPMASSLLSEMGADVVKVEPLEGEPWRLQAEFMPKESRAYMNQNRGKRGIAIDLKHPAAAPVRDALLRWADVVVINYRPGVAEQLGLSYEAVRQISPNIIYCENTAFGKEGPDAKRRGYDIIAQAMSGLITSSAVLNEGGVPQIVHFAPADALTGALMAWAITAALFHREKTGEGQAVTSSLMQTALMLQPGFKEIVAMDGGARATRLAALAAARERGASMAEIYERRRALTPELLGAVYYRVYQTKDGYIAVGCLGPGPRSRFRRALGFHDRRYDEDFDPTAEDMAATGRALVQECERIMGGRTTNEWLSHLDENDVAAGPVRFVEELWENPQVLANGYIAEYEHTLVGPLRGGAPAIRMSATPTRIQRASPALGEHNDDVLQMVGFDEAEVAAIRDSGAIL